MPLDHERKLIFIHVPKTGGGTITETLGIKSGHLNYFKYKSDDHGFISESQHWPVSLLRSCIDNKIKRWFTFSFVRNPYTRIISAYFWHNKDGDDEWTVYKFEKWMYNFLNSKHIHAAPQSFILDEEIDFIGKFENLHEDFQIAMRKSGCPNLKITCHLHDTKFVKDNLVNNLSRKSISMINLLYHEDFERFDYPKIRVSGIKFF